jgi:hypothetical protein
MSRIIFSSPSTLPQLYSTSRFFFFGGGSLLLGRKLHFCFLFFLVVLDFVFIMF